jgi:acid stress chaperone HdeB
MIMRCTPIVAGLVLSSIVFATVSTQAQVSIDVSKITCDEYVHDKIPAPDFISFSAVGSLSFEARAMLSRWLIANWLSGYYHAKRNNWTVDVESFENNVNKLNNYCYDEKNFKVPIMEAVERVLGK